MNKTFNRHFLVFMPAAFSLAIAVGLFWAAFALFVSDMHFGWAIGMMVVAVLIGIPSILLAFRLLRFKVVITGDSLVAPKIRPLGIKVKDTKISELNNDLKLGDKNAFEIVNGIFDNKLFGGRYRREKETIEFWQVESFDVAKIRTNYSKYIFLVFNYKDKSKRVIDVRPLGDKKAGLLIAEISTFVAKGASFKGVDLDNPFLDWEYVALEGGVHGLAEVIGAIVGCCCEGL